MYRGVLYLYTCIDLIVHVLFINSHVRHQLRPETKFCIAFYKYTAFSLFDIKIYTGKEQLNRYMYIPNVTRSQHSYVG